MHTKKYNKKNLKHTKKYQHKQINKHSKNKKINKEVYEFYNNLYLKTPIIEEFNSKNINKTQINKLFNFVRKINEYHYDDFNEMQDKVNDIEKINDNIKNNHIPELKIKMINKILDGYARGVSEFISTKFKKLPNRVSNAFCKLWELYNIDKSLFPLKPNPKIFNIAEAPGQWIFVNNHYYKKNYIEKHKGSNYEIEWVANTLNPKHSKNIEIFGDDIFSDDYGFLKKYPDRWIYGKDNTGDITIVENQIWYREYAKNFGNIDLVTNDAGLPPNLDLLLLQKLDFAVLCMILGVSSKGCNCVSKHFLSYLPTKEESYKATGLFVNTLYLYYLFFEEFSMVKPLTSSPNSGEFYVIGKNFKGITEEQHDKLLKVLKNFEKNNCFFDMNDIPKKFVDKVLNFNTELSNLIIKQGNEKTKLFNCYFKTDKDKEELCNSLLDINIMKQVNYSRFMNWISNNKFSI